MDSQRLSSSSQGVMTGMMMEGGFPGEVKRKQASLTNFFQVSRVPQQQQQQKKLYPEPVARDGGFMYFPVNGVSPRELLGTGSAKVVVNDKELALICHNNVVYAVQGKCPHAGGPLHLGDIEDLGNGCGPTVKCPWHKYTFSLTTGECRFPQHGERLETFPVQLASNGNVIKIGFNEISPKTFVTPPE